MTSRNVASWDGCTICSAGYTWDTIRVPVSLAQPTLALLAPWSGSVLVDPRAPAHMYWFVLPGTAYWWKLPGTHALGRGTSVVIPPGGRSRPPGPHWRVPPDNRRWFTDASYLHAALNSAVRDRH
ncbi:hypothetical protein ABZY90_19445 [Streptomyces sp. NPDC006422]|uniref:hypothetical protein n=1 Tax=unclassified Streptomyces TaxID=2593676 RepID=UPI0033B8179A